MRESVLPAAVLVARWFRRGRETERERERRVSFQVISQECYQDTGECFNLSQQYIPPPKADHRLAV
jgi:hypothetical protein